MSRCFPFPPPGYTRNTKVEDLDLLKKEKHREKKHKKDKEKKDSKEKREKDKSDGKHKEKKDKKEKHRDKTKEKDRDKDKHKSGSITPDDNRNVGLSGTHNLTPSEISKIREGDGGANLAEKRFRNGKQNNSPLVETKSFRNALELGKGSIDKERTVNQLPLKHVSTESKEIEFAKPCRNIARPSGSVSVPSSSGTVQNRDGVGRDMEKKVGHRLEDKEKIWNTEVGGQEQDRQKGKDGEKLNQTEKKSDDRVKVICGEQKYIEQSKIVDNGESCLLKSNVKDRWIKETSSTQNGGLQNASRDENRVVAPLNNLGKRKDAGFNGSYDVHSSGPNKLARTTTSTFPHNGRTLEPCRSSPFVDGKQRSPFNVKVEKIFPPDDTQMPSMNIKVDGKERKLNGTIVQQGSWHPSQTTPNTERKPHPDIKYLSQVLSVPKVDDWLGIDDQEWLFNSSSSQTRKPDVGSGVESCEIEPTPQVWDTALWLEPVDVYALPYVIPR